MSELTTSELLAMLHKSGMSVSHDQLKYWRRNSLLPKPVIRGKGRGAGVKQLWDEACIENVRLILDSNKGKRMNLMTAACYLFARSRPIGVQLLRRYLMELVFEMLETEKQRKKLADDNSELTELIRVLIPEKVKEAVTQTQANQMLSLYDSMSKFDTPLGAQVAWISNCHPVFDVLVQTAFPDLTGITSLPIEAIYRRQRSTLAWSVLIHHFGKKLSKIVSHAIQQIIIKKCLQFSHTVHCISKTLRGYIVAFKPLPIEKVRESLRLKFEENLPHRMIGRTLGIGHVSVCHIAKKFVASGQAWPTQLTNDELQRLLYREKPLSKPVRALPNFEEVKHLLDHGCSLRKIWQTYHSDNPEGYSRSRFYELFQMWLDNKLDVSNQLQAVSTSNTPVKLKPALKNQKN